MSLYKANGLVERCNQTLQTMLAKYAQSKKRQWSTYLSSCVFAYNTSCHDSSKFSPFHLMFGRQATIPIDLDILTSTPEEEMERFDDMEEPDTKQVEQERNRRLEEAKENIVKAQKKQKDQYDKKHAKPDLFKKGQLVLKKDFRRKKRKGGKLGMRFLGPYVIHKKLGRGVYELIKENGKKKARATGQHLKPYLKTSTSSSLVNSRFLCSFMSYCLLML